MSQAISIMSKPKKIDNLRWRVDGEEDQLVILHNDKFPLPQMLNPTAAFIFVLCDGKKTVEKIIEAVYNRFGMDDFEVLASEVKDCIGRFVEKEIVRI